MKHKILFLVIAGGFAGLAFFASGCKTKTTATSASETADTEEVSFTGKFRSIRGVMNPLSCYCYNGGYLTTSEGQEVPVCFEKDDQEVSCDGAMTVSGKWVTETIDPGNDSPCPAGSKRYVQVSTSECQ